MYEINVLFKNIYLELPKKKMQFALKSALYSQPNK